jgi:hypothetical protein
MAEFRLSTPDPELVDVRRLASSLVQAQGWPRDQVGLWQNAGGEIVVTVDEALLRGWEPDPLSEAAPTPALRHRAYELIKRHPTAAESLRAVGFEELREEVQPFLLAGWTPADVLHALSYGRDGTPWPTGPEYREAGARWLRHRLRDWKGPEGGIRPSPSQEDASLRVVHRSGLPADVGGAPPGGARRRAPPPAAPRRAPGGGWGGGGG